MSTLYDAMLPLATAYVFGITHAAVMDSDADPTSIPDYDARRLMGRFGEFTDAMRGAYLDGVFAVIWGVA